MANYPVANWPGTVVEGSYSHICGLLHQESLRRAEKKILFEPSDELPQVIRGTTSLGSGQRLYIRLENVGEEDQVLDPIWEIGTAEVIEEEPDFPAGEDGGEGLPEIPEKLSEGQRQSLQELLDEFKDVFVGRDFWLRSTGVVEHEIHTHGPLSVSLRKSVGRNRSS